MQILEHSSEPEFLSAVYCGRQIAIFHHYGRWHVYLDHVLQHNVMFASSKHAMVWLIRRVDHGVPARLN
jgi:hypothetical protein